VFAVRGASADFLLIFKSNFLQSTAKFLSQSINCRAH